VVFLLLRMWLGKCSHGYIVNPSAAGILANRQYSCRCAATN
jgi:hypothetical protein